MFCIYRESSRVVFIPFERAKEGSQHIDDTSLFSAFRDAGDAVPTLGQHFQEYDRADIDKKIATFLHDKMAA